MGTRGALRRLRAVAAAALAALVWLPAAGTVRAGGGETVLEEPLVVMTRNVFLGTNLKPMLQAADGLPPDPTLAQVEALAEATYAARAQVDATDFGYRAGRLADDIDRHRPDLVGLQEVALWRSGPFEPDAVGVPNAVAVDHDFLVVLLAALAQRGLGYTPMVAVEEADLELPSQAPPDGRGRTVRRDVRVTLRDVILVRESDDLLVQRTGQDHFRVQHRIAVPGRTAEFTRGYGWVDVRHHDDLLRFVNTHLEVGDARIGHAQARELVEGPAYVGRPVVVVCDCNSDPHRPLRSLPYRVFTGAGFVDQWLTVPHAGPGHTCCVPNTLLPADPNLLDHRVDFVFARATQQIRATYGALLGTPAPGDVLRPSDHAGLVVRIRSR